MRFNFWPYQNCLLLHALEFPFYSLPTLALWPYITFITFTHAGRSKNKAFDLAAWERGMANIKQILVFLVTSLVASTCVPVSLCAKKPVFSARKEDIPYIKCQVCEKVAKELYQLVEKKKAQFLPKKVIWPTGFGLSFVGLYWSWYLVGFDYWFEYLVLFSGVARSQSIKSLRWQRICVTWRRKKLIG